MLFTSKAVDCSEVGTCWKTENSCQDRLAVNGGISLRPDLNSKLFLWSGDICQLQCDAIVIGRSPKQHLNSELYDHVVQAAGITSVEEDLLAQDLPRSGEARITHGYRLQARHIVHVLRPRYPRKYERAAKTSLHRCVLSALEAATDAGSRNIVFTRFWCSKEGEPHPFPHRTACQLFARSLRSFLEDHSRLLDRVLIAVDNSDPNGQDDEDLMSALAAFFPRSVEESTSFGEETRRLDEEVHSPPAFMSNEISYAVPDYVQEDGTRRRPQNPSDRSTTSTAETRGNDPPRKDEVVLRKYAHDPLTDMVQLDAVKVAGADSEGRPILLWFQRKISVNNVNLERFLVHLLRMCEEATQSSQSGGEFFLAYVQEGCGLGNVPPLPWLWETIHCLSSRFGDRVRRVFIIGDALVRVVSFSMTVNLKIRDKIRFLSTTEQLLLQFPGGRLRRDVVHL